jgi:hypothetical protein
MIAESALFRLGVAAAKAVFKLWTKDDEVARAVGDEFMVIATSRLATDYEQRRLGRQIDQIADEIAIRLEHLLDVEFGGLGAGERAAAVWAVEQTVNSAPLGPSLILATELDPEQLEAALRETNPGATRDLAPAGAAFYDFLLREVSNYIVELATTLPSFERRTWSEVLKRESEILSLVHTVLERLPAAQAIQMASQDEVFEDRYGRAVARKLDKLELFGVTLASPQARYSLSVAYISLTASLTSAESNGDHTQASDPLLLKVEQALGPHSRLLIRGEAGSGKTTLLQWLAVKSARREFEDPLAEWNSFVPFLIRLRRWVGVSMPAPSDFITEVAANISSAMPHGWVQRILDQGRALVLIDGLDELPEHERAAARDWLRDLCDEFPDSRFIATSRPAAVGEAFLDEAHFVASELQPMTVPDMNRFVDHWHKAAAKEGLDASGELELGEMAAELKELVRTRPPLRNLASSPLLLALICALNRDRRTNLPRDRNELYRIALEMLLIRRDAERRIEDADHVGLSFPQIMALLEQFAFWLLLNEQTDARISELDDLIARELVSMPAVQTSAAEVRQHLLVRSGLLRQPIEGRVDFIHRTFQEYLAAKQAIGERNIGLLVSNADDDQWQEVIVLASGHATQQLREQLIAELLRRGDDDAENRHKVHLLAVACLETATQLAPRLQRLLRVRLQHLVPPRNMAEAHALASASALAIPLLTPVRATRAAEAAASIRTLSLIGGSEALDAISRFGPDRRVTVARELLRAWSLFDPVEYAERVLAESILDYGTVTVTDASQLRALPKLTNASHITADIELDGDDDLRPLARARGVVTLIARSRGSIELRDLAGTTNIRELDLRDVKGLVDVEQVGAIEGLSEADLRNHAEITNAAPLAALPYLQRLILDRSGLETLRSLSGSPVEHLEVAISAHLRSADGAEALPNLRFLDLQANEQLVDITALARCQKLRTLLLTSCPAMDTLPQLPPSLQRLNLSSEIMPEDCQWMSSAVELKELNIGVSRRLSSLNGLQSCVQLEDLTISQCRSLVDLTAISHLTKLKRLALRSCPAIGDIGVLSRLEHLESLDLTGTRALEQSAIEELQARGVKVWSYPTASPGQAT